MHNIVSKLLIYGNMPEDSILMELSNIIREYKGENYKKDEIITRIYHQIKRILEISTDYAFDKNLWHNYLTYLLSSKNCLIMILDLWKKNLELIVFQELKIIRL